MNLNDLLALSNASQKLRMEMNSFEALCTKLCILTDQENDDFISEAVSIRASISLKKVELLETFEERVQELFRLLKTEAPHNMALQTYFIDKIQNLQNKLRVNTSLQLHTMSKLQHKLEGRELGDACH